MTGFARFPLLFASEAAAAQRWFHSRSASHVNLTCCSIVIKTSTINLLNSIFNLYQNEIILRKENDTRKKNDTITLFFG